MEEIMPMLQEISVRVPDVLISVQVYGPDYFTDFSPAAAFEKLASVELKDFEDTLPGMSELILPAGEYAVFRYTGPAGSDAVYSNGQGIQAIGY